MMQPKRTKYRKPHRTKYDGKAKGNKYVAFGEYGLMATEGNWVSDKQLEALRVVLSKAIGTVGKLWIRVFPQLSLTKKPLEVRMGSGKGNPEFWVAVVKAGTVVCEIAGIPEAQMKEALRKAGNKLNVKTKIVKKGEIAHE
ncbi:50S ribosomal protein L16 [Candidatus Malacoplasma girerdii]|uniref:Large ribosomal subunit protein uL16 n=1 Tax=Candidatus Malacoplasma girerdii TaxID=1318617 RepID=A0A097SSA7_9BACT|nr:50S ribosomal protein L16 [Candidatus Malacoplasma girerdii]ASJ88987.1 MAG: 50S ribosomal protein L16 [Candidatus Malacoplasma girerdii]